MRLTGVNYTEYTLLSIDEMYTLICSSTVIRLLLYLVSFVVVVMVLVVVAVVISNQLKLL